MRKLSHHPKALIAPFIGLGLGVASAQEDPSLHGQPILIPSQSSVYNQNSVFLPTPPTVSGQDVVRSADGGSCQSAIASGGPYMDFGVIGSEDFYDRSTAALYGRLVVPLGKRARRVDCTKLYELEISRMRMEIDLLRMGTMMPPQQASLVSSGVSSEAGGEGLPDRQGGQPSGVAIGTEAKGNATAQRSDPPVPKVTHPTALAPIPAQARSLDVALAEIAAPPPPRRKTKRTKDAPDPKFYAQIGAFSTPARASAALKQLDRGARSEVRIHDTGTNIFFRALLGPYTYQEAGRLCQRLPSCLVTEG
ncbi:MAG: SPOR domain-containing protein [Parvularcula sp.]